jgi:thioredoxin reductase (NADPH)
VLIGAVPRTEWLPESIARDDAGYVRTSIGAPGSSPFTTGLDGVLAVGDVRAGSVKRVASAVGEGSVVVPALHNYLAQRTAGPPR